jgi:hypothetical protein
VRVCRFLEVEQEPRPALLGQRLNEHVTFRSLWLRNRSQRWPKRLRDAVGRLNSRQASYPPLDDDIHSALSSQFQTWNKRLCAWLDRKDLPWDCANEEDGNQA